MIYLDNAATSYQKPEAVYQAVQEAMHHMGNSGRGAHGASLDASRQIYSARKLLAELFHAGDPSRVAFTANSTESLNMAVFGLFGPGDHVITTMLEHNSVLRPLYLLEEAGLELTILPADQNGCICYEDIEKAIRPNTKGIICTHASNLTGTLNGHGIAGLYAALRYIQETGMEQIRERELSLMRQFYDGVRTIPGVTIYGDFTGQRAPIVSLNIRDYDSGEVADELAYHYEIYTRAGAHCAPLMHRALGTESTGAVRFSMSHFNTEAEIAEAVRAVHEIANTL